jgi:hypothetical protein
MRRTVIALVSLAAACGAPSQAPAKDQSVRLELPDAGPTTAPAAKTERLGLPRDAAFEMSLDVSALLVLAPELRGQIERSLDLAPGSFDLAALGLDARRPVVLAVATLDAAQRKLVERVRPLAASKTPTPATAAAIRDVLALGVESPLRVLVPVTNVDKARSTVDALLRKEGWRPRGADAYERHRGLIVLSHDEATLAVDVASAHTPSEAAAIARTAFAAATDPVPGLDGEVAHVTWRPAELARFGFLKGIVTTCAAVSGESIDPAQRERIAAQGFWEAGQLFGLAGNPRGAFFDRVDVSARIAPFEVTMRARPGPGLAAIPPDAFKPSPSVGLDVARTEIDGTRALMGAWGAVADGPKLLESMRDGGTTAWFVALPQLVASASTVAPSLLGAGAPEPAAVARFERTEVAFTSSRDAVFAGILPAGATRAAARCALAPSTPCDAKSMLKPGAVVSRAGRSAKLLEVDHRWVVLVSSDEKLLQTVKTTPRPEGPVHVDAELGQLASALHIGNLPPRVVGDVTSTDGALVFRLAAP